MRKSKITALLLAMVLTLAGCKATPKDDIVKGKNLDKMIENATKSQTDGTKGEKLSEKVGAEKTYVKELVDAKNKVKIHVNADVQIPDSNGISVQRVQADSFSQKTTDILVQKLMKGDQLFSGKDYKMSKSEIEQKILELQASITKGGSKNPKVPSYLQGTLDDLKEKLKTAPETATKIPITGKLEESKDKTEPGQQLYALAQSDKGGYESLKVFNSNSSDEAINFVRYDSEKNAFSEQMGNFSTAEKIKKAEALGGHGEVASQDIAKIPDVTITKEAAKAKADDLISALGIDYLTCITEDKAYGGSGVMGTSGDLANPKKCVWYLRYSRSVNGLPITHTAYDCMKVDENAQSSPWSYEDMIFAIDDSGIVGFEWKSPYKVTGTVTENSNLLSFSDAMKVFDNMSLVVNSWDGYANGNPNLTGVEINVDHIQLGLTRVTEPNKRNSGLLVPAWDFFGTVTSINKINGQTKNFSQGPVPILTVNAIDGSVINRSVGY